MYYELAFPNPRYAADHGLVAVGGDYRPERLLAAYACGIFPWPSEDLPFAWFSPNPRLVMRPNEVRISRSLRKSLRRHGFRVTFDEAFERVVDSCAAMQRSYHDDPEGGSWIIEDLRRGMLNLHQLGFAHSAETWLDGELVGGLYGVSLGTTFCGESMFYKVRDASKVAFVHLAERLGAWHFRMIDCQVYTEHLVSLGAQEWPRDRFLAELARALAEPTRRGAWNGEP